MGQTLYHTLNDMQDELKRNSDRPLINLQWIYNWYLKLESTQNDQSPCQLWLFFAKISFKPPFEGYFEHYAVSKPGID